VEREDIRKLISVIIVSVTEIVIIDKWLGYNHEDISKSGCELIS
jgi:hypothetical protein